MSKPFEHKPGTGSLFQNDRKQKDNHPDWKGEININGTIYEIASWWKEGKRGGFHSLLVSEKKPFERGETRERGERQERRQEYYQERPTTNRRETVDDVFPDEEGGW